MDDYEFTLRFALRGGVADPKPHVVALKRPGLLDVVIVDSGKHGRLALGFTRSARSADQAVQSALDDVRKAVRAAQLIEVCPDLMGLSDIAYWAGCTRQNLRKLSMGGSGFPLAMHEGNPELFHLADVLAWVKRSGRARVPGAVVEMAETARAVNVALQVRALRKRSGIFTRLTRRRPNPA
jgi:hypothetical protein